jgi:hypothetical protein
MRCSTLSLAAYAARLDARRGPGSAGTPRAAGVGPSSGRGGSPAMAAAMAALERAIPATFARVRLRQARRNREVAERRRATSRQERLIEAGR